MKKAEPEKEKPVKPQSIEPEPQTRIGNMPITIQVTMQMEEALKILVATGFYGFSIEEAAERILAADLYQRSSRR
jgi:hypothetical protein